MIHLYRQLKMRHLQDGLTVYCRIGAPYWIRLVGGTVAFLLGWTVGEWVGNYSFAARLPAAGLTLGSGALFFLATMPGLRKASQRCARRLETDFYRSQFALFSKLDRFNRWSAGLLVAIALALLWQRDEFELGKTMFWLWLGAVLSVLAATVAASIALYGWLGDQFEDFRRPPR